ncbi:MAG: hypothetical protein HKM98_05095 [Gammaproteobacteria bacterium]|nr:hypothetical protein [Gammaproteobacteria bacterium]
MDKMQVGFQLNNLVRYARIRPPRSDLSAALPQSVVSPAESAQRNLNRQRVEHTTRALNELDNLLARAKIYQSSGVSSVSSPNLDLNSSKTATTLESVAEINTATTSYTPFGPTFSGSGGSDALPTLSGVYDGSNGDDTLRFKVTRTGIHTVSRIDVKVYNSEGDFLERIKIDDEDPIDQEYVLENGLIFTLGAGTLVKNDDFYMDVYANTPSAVDPDKSFNGTRDDRPNFDHGLSVGAGSFDVNGETITVNASDTINDVVARITASAAGVDAIFDEATESVQLTQRSLGSDFDIVLDNDSSGFLAAAKLTGPATPGLDTEADIALAQTSRFSGVSSGNILINGSSFAIDVNNDSIKDIVTMINDAEIGVTASLSNNNQRFALTAIAGISISLNDQGTQFFDALNVAEKTYRTVSSSSGLSRSRTYKIADAAADVADLINEIFNPATNLANSLSLTSLQETVIASIRAGAPDGETAIGLEFKLDNPVGNRFAAIDRQQLTRSLRHKLGTSQNYFGGFITGLRGALAAYGANFGDAGISSGTMLNTRA